MPPAIAYIVSGTACAYILIFSVIYMFPYVYPVDVLSMNYVCVMVGGINILLTILYLWKRTVRILTPIPTPSKDMDTDILCSGYEGPRVIQGASDDILVGTVGLSKQEAEMMRRGSVSGVR